MILVLKDKLSAFFSHRVTLILSFFVLLPRFIIEPVKLGIDPSWKIALGLANATGMLFGQDIVFTYGPLHYFVTKSGVSYQHKWAIILFELTAILFVLFIISEIFRKERHPLKGFVLLMFCFLFSGFSSEYYLLLIFLYSAYQVLLRNKTGFLFVMLLIAVVTFFIKINFGFINFIGLLLVCCGYAIRHPEKFLVILLTAIAFPLAVFFLSTVLHVSLNEYLINGLRIIGGYSNAMVIPVSSSDLVDCTGFFILCVFVFLLLNNLRFFLRAKHILPFLLFLFYFFLLFKNAYVRADGHVFIFIFNSLILYLIFYLWNPRLRYLRQTFIIALFFAFLSIPLAALNFTVFKQDSWFNPLEKIDCWSYELDLLSNLKHKSVFHKSKIDPVKVSKAQLQIISGNTVDVLPEDITVIYRHQLRYNPRPIVQSYSAYTLYLDSLNAKKYNASDAPDYLLYLNRSIDGRVPFWDESITKRAIMKNYSIEDTEMRYDTSFLLFQKRSVQQKELVMPVLSFASDIALPVDVPQDSGNVYLYLDLHYSLYGKLKNLLFQAPVVYVQFTYEDNSTEKYRCIPAILQTGVLINKMVKTNQDAYRFFSGKHNALKKIVRFQLLPTPGFDAAMQGRFIRVTQSP